MLTTISYSVLILKYFFFTFFQISFCKCNKGFENKNKLKKICKKLSILIILNCLFMDFETVYYYIAQ